MLDQALLLSTIRMHKGFPCIYQGNKINQSPFCHSGEGKGFPHGSFYFLITKYITIITRLNEKAYSD